MHVDFSYVGSSNNFFAVAACDKVRMMWMCMRVNTCNAVEF